MTPMMRLLALFAALGAWVFAVEATSNNLTNLVTWDKYSLGINGTRVFIKFVATLATTGRRTDQR